MKKSKRAIIIAAVVLALSVLAITAASAQGGDIYDSLSFKASVSDENTTIKTQKSPLDGKTYLFLPSSADLSSLTVYFDESFEDVSFANGENMINIESGVPFDFTSIFPATSDEYNVTVTADGQTSGFTVMKSAKVRSMYLVSDDPVNYGRPWVDSSKENIASGKMAFIGVNGSVDFSNSIKEIKGRGNSTFTDYEKKPYQIKLINDAALLGNASDAGKTWVLLANAAESTLIHNSVTFDFANTLGFSFTPLYEPVDLYYDGEYRGSYLLTEKTEVAPNRVNINDLDSMVEQANLGSDALLNPVYVTKTTASAGTKTAKEGSSGSYKFVEGLKEPPYPSGAGHHAYLLEIEYDFRYPEENCGFVTKRGQSIVLKSPDDYLTKGSGAYISNFWQEFEDAVYNSEGYNRNTGKYYYDYCDLNSLVNLYLINELGKNYDAFSSSAYFYLSERSNKMYAGPVWDFDICYGIGHNNRNVASNPQNFYVTTKYLISKLIKIDSFREAVKSALNSESGKFYKAALKLSEPGGTIDKQAELVSQSQKMNFKIWDITDDYSTVVRSGQTKNYNNAVDYFKYFIDTRVKWLSSESSKWSGDNFSIKTDTGIRNYNPFVLFFDKLTELLNSILDMLRIFFN